MKEISAAVTVTQMDYDAKREKIMSLVQEQLDELTAEYAPMLESAKSLLADLEKQAKELVVANGESAKVDGLSVSYVKGRVSWDTKALDGYAAAHPEIEQFRKEGEPSARISWK